jgi:aminoglycoside phosphotransferase (APT) family kinase protein
MRLGEVIARGSRSIVYEWGPDAVAKVPLPGTPEGWIRFEANYATAVHACGVPSPRVLGLESINGRDVSIFERIDGPTMWECVTSKSHQADAVGKHLGELHGDLLSLLGPIALPTQRTRVLAKLYTTERCVDPSAARFADQIPDDDSRKVLCHGDFHPMNIIMTAQGPIIVDWFDVSRGAALGDIARTSLLLAAVGHAHLPGATAELLGALRTEYLRAVQIRTSIDFELLPLWMEIQSAARLSEKVDQQLSISPLVV